MVREAVQVSHRNTECGVHPAPTGREANSINVVVGLNERSPHGIGTLYNTVVTIADDGKLLGRHRKLVPTWAEKLTWANGDASSLRVPIKPV